MILFIKDTLRLIRKLYFNLLYSGVTPFLRFISKRIVLTYDADSKQDGTGAQIQRILAIYALSKKLSSGFRFSPIKSVAIHPLDSFQTIPEMQSFLKKANFAFALPESQKLESVRTVIAPSLTLQTFLKIAIPTFFRGDQLTIKTVEPYAFLDRMPYLYELAVKDLLNWKSIKIDFQNRDSKPRPNLAIHYRQGVGGLVVQSGEKYPREIPVSYFLDILTNRLSIEDFRSIDIYTDSPGQDMFFSPPADQGSQWGTNPKFDGKRLEVKSTDLSKLSRITNNRARFHSGGDPLDAIISMSCADVLLIGRSSLSYIAGLLNENGQIHYPPNFWHSPLSHWIRKVKP